MNSNTKYLVAMTTALLLVAAALTIPAAYADTRKTIVNKCEIDQETGKCEFDQVYKSKKGDINVKNEIDASAIANGGGSGGTIDQTARDGLENLTTVVNNNNASQTLINSEQSASIANITTHLNGLLNMFEDAITDVDNSTGTVEPPTNDTGNGFPPTNDTDTGTGGNETNGDGGNETEGNFTG